VAQINIAVGQTVAELARSAEQIEKHPLPVLEPGADSFDRGAKRPF
jgi:hypothetical protein